MNQIINQEARLRVVCLFCGETVYEKDKAVCRKCEDMYFRKKLQEERVVEVRRVKKVIIYF